MPCERYLSIKAKECYEKTLCIFSLPTPFPDQTPATEGLKQLQPTEFGISIVLNIFPCLLLVCGWSAAQPIAGYKSERCLVTFAVSYISEMVVLVVRNPISIYPLLPFFLSVGSITSLIDQFFDE